MVPPASPERPSQSTQARSLDAAYGAAAKHSRDAGQELFLSSEQQLGASDWLPLAAKCCPVKPSRPRQVELSAAPPVE